MDFNLQWVKSIWERPDFNQYYKNEIAEIENRLVKGTCWLPPEPEEKLVEEHEGEEEEEVGAELPPEALLALGGKTVPTNQDEATAGSPPKQGSTTEVAEGEA